MTPARCVESIVLVAVTAIALCVAPAGAQDAQPTADNYQTVIEGALAEFDAGNFGEARALFHRAHDLQPSARTLRGIGMTSFELREYADCIRTLSASLTDTRRPLDDAQRAQVQGLLERARGFVGRYRFDVSPTSAEVLVDGRSVSAESDGMVLLDLGHHTVVARAPGHLDASVSLTVRGGESDTIRLEPEGAAGPVRAAGPAAPSHRAPPPPGSSAGSVALFVTAGALAAGSALSGIFWWRTRNDQLARCDASSVSCDNRDTISGERTAAIAMTIGLGVAAVGATVAGLLMLPSSEPEESRASLHCAPGLAAITCHGQF